MSTKSKPLDLDAIESRSATGALDHREDVPALVAEVKRLRALARQGWGTAMGLAIAEGIRSTVDEAAKALASIDAPYIVARRLPDVLDEQGHGSGQAHEIHYAPKGERQ